MRYLFTTMALILLSFAAFSQSANSVTGKWYTEDKESVIRIYESGGEYYGKIVWMEEPRNDDGSHKRDKNNPKSSLRSRKLQGLVILKGFEYDGKGEWEDGHIYDPDSGKTYKAKMELDGNNKLDLRGYIGVPALGRTTTWQRKTKH